MKHEWRFDPNALTTPTVDKLIRHFMAEQPCWRVTRVLGSMLVLDFGGREATMTRRGAPIAVGTEQLSIRNVYWRSEGDILARTTSDLIDGPATDRLNEAFQGVALEGCSSSKNRLVFKFSRGLRISVDLTNRYEIEADEQIFELRMSSGLSLFATAGGGFDLRGAQPPGAASVAA